eukprot:349736-Chlamydomonas_euryale.AAC.2
MEQQASMHGAPHDMVLRRCASAAMRTTRVHRASQCTHACTCTQMPGGGMHGTCTKHCIWKICMHACMHMHGAPHHEVPRRRQPSYASTDDDNAQRSHGPRAAWVVAARGTTGRHDARRRVCRVLRTAGHGPVAKLGHVTFVPHGRRRPESRRSHADPSMYGRAALRPGPRRRRATSQERHLDAQAAPKSPLKLARVRNERGTLSQQGVHTACTYPDGVGTPRAIRRAIRAAALFAAQGRCLLRAGRAGRRSLKPFRHARGAISNLTSAHCSCTGLGRKLGGLPAAGHWEHHGAMTKCSTLMTKLS